jgi:hypothetical protein
MCATHRNRRTRSEVRLRRFNNARGRTSPSPPRAALRGSHAQCFARSIIKRAASSIEAVSEWPNGKAPLGHKVPPRKLHLTLTFRPGNTYQEKWEQSLFDVAAKCLMRQTNGFARQAGNHPTSRYHESSISHSGVGSTAYSVNRLCDLSAQRGTKTKVRDQNAFPVALPSVALSRSRALSPPIQSTAEKFASNSSPTVFVSAAVRWDLPPIELTARNLIVRF